MVSSTDERFHDASDKRHSDSWLRRVMRGLSIGRRNPHDSLFEFRRIGFVPSWLQALLVVVLFVATVLCTHAEYRAKGTVFGFGGPAFNVLFVPIYEELIFRGWILGQLARRYSNVTAISIASFLFGLLHIRNIYWMDSHSLIRMMAYTGLVLGPILGYVTLKSRSVWPAVILHYVNNLGYYV